MTAIGGSTAGSQVLVASGLGTGGGGVFALGAGGFTALDYLSTTGLAVAPSQRLLARVLWKEDPLEAPGEVLFYDERGGLGYRRVDPLREPHAAAWHGDELVLVSTGTNALLWLDAGGSLLRTYQAPGTGDCWHLNGLVVHDGRLLASAFGRFEEHRGWAAPGARDGAGILFDVESGTDVLRDLSSPHDPTPVDGGWLICNSAAGDVLRLDGDGRPVLRRHLGGWPRGLAVSADRVYVGVSAHRLARGAGTASVVALDRRTLEETGRWPLPCPEVFALTWMPPALVDGLRAGFTGSVMTRRPATPVLELEPLPESEFAVRVVVTGAPASVSAVSPFLLGYSLENRSRTTLVSAGRYPVNVGVRWFHPSSGQIVEEIRDRLQGPLAPGATAEGTMELWTPAKPGEYVLLISAVQEQVRWFDEVRPENGVALPITVTEDRVPLPG